MVERGRYVTLENLSPLVALQVLAQAARALRAAGVSLAPLVDVRIGMETLGGLTTVGLLIPAGGGRGQSPAIKQTTEAILRAYSDRVGGIIPGPRDALADGAVTLPDGAARLLLHPSDQPAEPDPSEYLLIAEGVSSERAARIFEDARFDATSVRTLAAVDARHPDAPVYLFHIRDDRGRRSTFQGALTGERFSDCTLLAAFDAGSGAKVFLPPELVPGRPELEAFRDLVQVLPLSGGQPAVPAPAATNGHRPDRDERLVAVYPRRSAGQQSAAGPDSVYAVAYLGGLAFRDQLDLQPRRRAGIYEVVDLRASEAVAANLRDVIERSGAGIGYRLELRTTEYVEPPEEQELIRLDQEIFDLELRRAALRSLSPQKPFLYRFSQSQLAGLADVLRSYPPRILREGGLQYAFQPAAGARGGAAVHDERSGLHFLLVDPARVGPLMEKLRFPEFGLSGPTMRFWLDPYWARYYLDDRALQGECLVFVPYGTSLFPSMHDWDLGEMQEYLHFAVQRWFAPSGGADTAVPLPERAVYIFDGDPSPNAIMQVTVLDRDGFCPLQQRIGWINTNLEAMRPDADVEDVIERIADARTREAVLGTISARVSAAEAAFDQTVVEASAHVAAHLQELLDALTVEMNGLIDRAQRTTEDVVRLKTRLRDLDTTRLDLRQVDDNVTGAATVAGQAADTLDRYYNDQLRKAQEAVRRANASRVTADKEIAEAVQQLIATRTRLEELLGDLW
ncbi:MAG: hypothetical protein AB7P40_03370 [Chloroflexota bacterium]